MIKNVIFDCDGTITHVEGIDLLAEMNAVWEEVSAITRRAMNKSSLTVDIFEQRLELVQPTLEQVQDLGDLYIANLSRDVKEVIELLQNAGGISQKLQNQNSNLCSQRFLNVPKLCQKLLQQRTREEAPMLFVRLRDRHPNTNHPLVFQQLS